MTKLSKHCMQQQLPAPWRFLSLPPKPGGVGVRGAVVPVTTVGAMTGWVTAGVTATEIWTLA